jgi:hypothetical protein
VEEFLSRSSLRLIEIGILTLPALVLVGRSKDAESLSLNIWVVNVGRMLSQNGQFVNDQLV